MVPGCDLNTMMSPTRTPKVNSVHFPPLGQTEEQQRTSPESPSQQIQHKQKQEVEKKVSLNYSMNSCQVSSERPIL